MDKKIISFHGVVSLPFNENTYVLRLGGRPHCVVVDPGFEPEKILQSLTSLEVEPVAILNTHGHSDHIAGNQAIKDLWPAAPLIIGEGDAVKLTDPALNLSASYGFPLVSPACDQTVADGDVVEFADITFEVRHTPGHSPGHVVFLCRQHDPWIVVGGDVLFRGSIGRTDFPDGNHDDLVRSIRERLFDLPDETIVLTGHGESTTIGYEKATNPYVRVG